MEKSKSNPFRKSPSPGRQSVGAVGGGGEGGAGGGEYKGNSRSKSCPETNAPGVKPEVKPQKRRFSIFNVFRSKKSPQEPEFPSAVSVSPFEAERTDSGARGGGGGSASQYNRGGSKSADHSPERGTNKTPKSHRNSLFNLFAAATSRKRPPSPRPHSYSVWHGDDLGHFFGGSGTKEGAKIGRGDVKGAGRRRCSHDDILMTPDTSEQVKSDSKKGEQFSIDSKVRKPVKRHPSGSEPLKRKFAGHEGGKLQFSYMKRQDSGSSDQLQYDAQPRKSLKSDSSLSEQLRNYSTESFSSTAAANKLLQEVQALTGVHGTPSRPQSESVSTGNLVDLTDVKSRYHSEPPSPAGSGAAMAALEASRDGHVTILITPSSSGDLSVTSSSTTTLPGDVRIPQQQLPNQLAKVGDSHGTKSQDVIDTIESGTGASTNTFNKLDSGSGALGNGYNLMGSSSGALGHSTGTQGGVNITPVNTNRENPMGRVSGKGTKPKPRPPPLTLLEMTRPTLSTSVPNLVTTSSSTVSSSSDLEDSTVGHLVAAMEASPPGGYGSDESGSNLDSSSKEGSSDQLSTTVWYDDTKPSRKLQKKKRSSSSVDDLLSHITRVTGLSGTPPPSPKSGTAGVSSKSASGSPTKPNLSPKSAASLIMAQRRPRAHSDVSSLSQVSVRHARQTLTGGSVDDDGFSWALAYDDSKVPSYPRTHSQGSKTPATPTSSSPSIFKVPSSPSTSKRLFGRFLKKRHSQQLEKMPDHVTTPTLEDAMLINPYLLLPSLDPNQGQGSGQGSQALDTSTGGDMTAGPGTTSKTKKPTPAQGAGPGGGRRKSGSRESGSPKDSSSGLISPLFRRRRANTADFLEAPCTGTDQPDGLVQSHQPSPTDPCPPTPTSPALLSPPPPRFGRKRAGSLPTLAVDFSILTQRSEGGGISGSGTETEFTDDLPHLDLDILPAAGGAGNKQDKKSRKLSAILEWGSQEPQGRPQVKVKDVGKVKVKARSRGYSQDFTSTVSTYYT